MALPKGHPERITHLIFVHGLDIGLYQRALYRQVLAHIRAVADAEGLAVLLPRTNLRHFGCRFVRYNTYFGAALAAVGLAHGSLLRRVMIAGSISYDQYEFAEPDGSDPRLDQLWSTETMTFVHDGCETTRLEKVTGLICRSDLALRHLRVCWKNRHGRYNCGQCEKCLRTMLALYVGGGLARCPTFPEPLTPASVARWIRVKDEAHLIFARENLAGLESLDCRDGVTEDLGRALSCAIKRGEGQVVPWERQRPSFSASRTSASNRRQ